MVLVEREADPKRNNVINRNSLSVLISTKCIYSRGALTSHTLRGAPLGFHTQVALTSGALPDEKVPNFKPFLPI